MSSHDPVKSQAGMLGGPGLWASFAWTAAYATGVMWVSAFVYEDKRYQVMTRDEDLQRDWNSYTLSWIPNRICSCML